MCSLLALACLSESSYICKCNWVSRHRCNNLAQAPTMCAQLCIISNQFYF